MLDKVQVGDHVQFQLDRVNSVYTITKIDAQK
jgi:Cu/Ag efflux protein CusF